MILSHHQPCRKRRRLEETNVLDSVTLTYPPKENQWQEILQKLQTQQKVSFRPLHSRLLLHLGYSLSIEVKENVSIQSLLCRCWKELYVKSFPADLESDELDESLFMVTRILGRSHDPLAKLSCLRVAESLCSWGYKHQMARNQSFLKSLVKTVGDDEVLGRSLSCDLLRRLSKQKEKEASILYASAQVMCGGVTTLEYMSLDLFHLAETFQSDQPCAVVPDSIPKEDALLFLSGLAHSPRMVRQMAKSTSLLTWLESNNAYDYLATIAINLKEPSSVLSHMFVSFFEDGKGDTSIMLPALSAIFKVNKCQVSTTLMKKLQEIVMERDQGTTATRAAAEIICDNMPTTDLSPLLPLLCPEMSHDTLQLALKTIKSSVKEEPSRLVNAPNVVTAVARICLNDSTPQTLKDKALEIIISLSREEANITQLVRIPKVLEALVTMASVRQTFESGALDASQNQTAALTALVKLTTLVCNRRILAQQSGLLSCLIQHVRSMPPSVEPKKQQLKDLIMQVARFL